MNALREPVTIQWGQILTAIIVSGIGGALTVLVAQASMREQIDSHEKRIMAIETTVGVIARDTRQTAIDVAEIKGALSARGKKE